MKKIFLPLLLLLLLFTGCQSNNVKSTNTISITDIDNMSIKAMPSPPKMKNITGKSDIEKVIKHINSIKKEKTTKENIKGWEFLIQTKGNKEHSISFIDHIMNIDGSFYKVNSDEVIKFRDLYNNLNYEEKDILE